MPKTPHSQAFAEFIKWQNVYFLSIVLPYNVVRNVVKILVSCGQNIYHTILNKRSKRTQSLSIYSQKKPHSKHIAIGLKANSLQANPW